MADIKEAFAALDTFTVTNANLATSATAGWQSAAVDNSTGLYLDYMIRVRLAAVNTAPANSKAIFLYVFPALESSSPQYASTGDGTASGSEGTLTFPDVSTLPVVAPLLGNIAYPVQNKAINSPEFSVAAACGGWLPPWFSIGMINHSGMTLNVTDIKGRPVYNTVA